VLSFETTGDFETFYNHLRMLKSPSFGTEFTLCCPYVYLAHYDLTKTKDGLSKLSEAGVSPHLCRLSVGLESADEIIQTLEESLKIL
jgi:cystathionine gamma-synthase